MILDRFCCFVVLCVNWCVIFFIVLCFLFMVWIFLFSFLVSLWRYLSVVCIVFVFCKMDFLFIKFMMVLVVFILLLYFVSFLGSFFCCLIVFLMWCFSVINRSDSWSVMLLVFWYLLVGWSREKYEFWVFIMFIIILY